MVSFRKPLKRKGLGKIPPVRGNPALKDWARLRKTPERVSNAWIGSLDIFSQPRSKRLPADATAAAGSGNRFLPVAAPGRPRRLEVTDFTGNPSIEGQ